MQIWSIRSSTLIWQIIYHRLPILVILQIYPSFKRNKIQLERSLTICCAITGILPCPEIHRVVFNGIPLCYSVLNATTTLSLWIYSISKKILDNNSPVEYVDTIQSRDLFQGGLYFSSICTCEQVFKEWNWFKITVSTSHVLFPKACLDKTMNNWLEGSHLVM